jgi:hypothetical protein
MKEFFAQVLEGAVGAIRLYVDIVRAVCKVLSDFVHSSTRERQERDEKSGLNSRSR